MGKSGIIHHIKDSGDLVVSYHGNPYVINPAAVVKVSKNLELLSMLSIYM